MFVDNIICMKWGDRYDASYVNKLAAMTRRWLKRPYRFVCFTDDAAGIDSEVEIRPLPEMELDAALPERGWRKLTVFRPQLADLSGRALFLDLDMILVGPLDPFFETPGDFRIIKDWNLSRTYIGNSSVFRFEIGRHADVLDYWLKNAALVRKNHRNEQAFLSWFMKEKGILEYWDPDWCWSFKRHCLRPFPLGYFLKPKQPGPGTKIVVFHGQPNPHQVLDGWRSRHGWRAVRPAPWIRDAWATSHKSINLNK